MLLSLIKAACHRKSPKAQPHHLFLTVWRDLERENPSSPLDVKAPKCQQKKHKTHKHPAEIWMSRNKILQHIYIEDGSVSAWCPYSIWVLLCMLELESALVDCFCRQWCLEVFLIPCSDFHNRILPVFIAVFPRGPKDYRQPIFIFIFVPWAQRFRIHGIFW